MHIVSRRNMLALPVERLVGNSSHSQHHGGGHHSRPPMTMSPDSSASDSSQNSDSHTTTNSSTNAKVFSSYASQLLHNNNNTNNNNNGEVNSPQTPPTCNNSIIINSISRDKNKNHNNRRKSDYSSPSPSPPHSPIMSMPTRLVKPTPRMSGSVSCLITSSSSSSPSLSSSDNLFTVKDIKTSPQHSPSPPQSREGSPGSTFEDPGREKEEGIGEEMEGKDAKNKCNKNKELMTEGTLLSTKNEMKEEKLDIESIQTSPLPGESCSTTTEMNSTNREGGGKLDSQNSVCETSVQVERSESRSQRMTTRLIENDDECCSPSSNSNNSSAKLNNGGDDNNGICGRPPSRPPSSSMVMMMTPTTTFPISPPLSIPAAVKDPLSKITALGNNSVNNTSIPSRPQQLLHHNLYNRSSGGGNGNSLKFSIDDILRPEFGKVAIQRINRLSPHHHRRSSVTSSEDSSPYQRNQQQQHRDANNELSSPRTISTSSFSSHSPHNCHPALLDEQMSQCSNNCSSNVNNGSHKRHSHNSGGSRGPSSVKDHSEDSNSSCTSLSRREEVVDETKVNPKVPQGPLLWPAWVYCTRYSDRPSSGPRSRRVRKRDGSGEPGPVREQPEEKRPRTAFTADQLQRLKQEFDENRYLTEKRRQDLARDLKLHENQIKIWFQNKRAKLKKSSGSRNGLALQLMAQGLYNHSTVPIDEDDEMYEAMMQQQ